MDRRGAWDALCMQLAHQAGKNVDLLWECDNEIQGTVVWLNRNNPPKKDGDDGSRQNKDVRKLFLVNEATSDRLLLKPVIQHSGAVSATCLTRADAVKLQLATQDDFLGDRMSELMFVWLVSRLQSQDLKWSRERLKSRCALQSKPSSVNPMALSLHSKRMGEPPNLRQRPQARISSGRHGCQDALLRKQDATFESAGLAVSEAGTSAARTQSTRPVPPVAAAQLTKHLKWTKSTDGMSGVVPHPKPLKHKPVSLPKSSSNAVKKVAGSKKRLTAALKRTREVFHPARVHERKEKQKQSFLDLPRAETEAIDLPSMRNLQRQ